MDAKTLIENGNNLLCKNDLTNAAYYYSRVLMKEESVKADLNIVLTCLLAKEKNIIIPAIDYNLAVMKIKSYDANKIEQLNNYVFRELYEENIFNKFIKSFNCVDFLCKYYNFSDEIIYLFYSYYKSIDVSKISIEKLLLLQEDMERFSLYIKAHSKKCKDYAENLFFFSKKLMLDGVNKVTPFLKSAIILYDNVDFDYYYYCNLLSLYIDYNDGGLLDNELILTQKKICSFRNDLLNNIDDYISFVLPMVNDFSFVKKCSSKEDYIEHINSRINVCCCALQFIDGFYTNNEKECFELLSLFKHYIKIKLCGDGLINNNLVTYCVDMEEYKNLSKIHNTNLQIFGDKRAINYKPSFSRHYYRNDVILSSIERDFDNMLAYANMFYNK